MSGTSLDAEQRGIIRTIGSAGDSLLRQINNILNLSRIEAGKMPNEQIDFDLSEVLSTARAMVLAQAQQKELRLTIHIAPQTPLQLHGSKHHLEEVLLNLLGNAIKFTEKGYVTLAAHPVNENNKQFIRLIVSDTGIGIASPAVGKIFESFTQADETIINRFGGTGLGLSICRQMVEVMGGKIGVDSREGHGSCFWFTIPMRSADQEASGRQLSRLIQPLLVCSNPGLAQAIAPRLSDRADVAVTRTLSEGSEWVRRDRNRQIVLFYYSDLPGNLLAAELESADLPGAPVLIARIRREASRHRT